MSLLRLNVDYVFVGYGGRKDLLSAVFAHSQHGERRLVDEDVQRELDVLEGRTQTVGEQMRRLDMEGLSSEVRRLQRSVLNSK